LVKKPFCRAQADWPFSVACMAFAAIIPGCIMKISLEYPLFADTRRV
jgi:hypothetical protein